MLFGDGRNNATAAINNDGASSSGTNVNPKYEDRRPPSAGVVVRQDVDTEAIPLRWS